MEATKALVVKRERDESEGSLINSNIKIQEKNEETKGHGRLTKTERENTPENIKGLDIKTEKNEDRAEVTNKVEEKGLTQDNERCVFIESVDIKVEINEELGNDSLEGGDGGNKLENETCVVKMEGIVKEDSEEYVFDGRGQSTWMNEAQVLGFEKNNGQVLESDGVATYLGESERDLTESERDVTKRKRDLTEKQENILNCQRNKKQRIPKGNKIFKTKETRKESRNNKVSEMLSSHPWNSSSSLPNNEETVTRSPGSSRSRKDMNFNLDKIVCEHCGELVSRKDFKQHSAICATEEKHSYPGSGPSDGQGDDSQFKCQECDQEFSQLALLVSHAMVAHPSGLKTSEKYTCKECDLVFKYQARYNQHLKTHFKRTVAPSTMSLKDFYRKVTLTEKTAVAFLREYNLLETPQEADPCHRCGSVMQEKRKRDRGGEFRPVLRCPRKGCQTSRSVRKGNAFFHYTDMNNKLRCNLSLSEILELVLFFVLEIPINTTVKLTGKSSRAITDWYKMCREVCGAIVSHSARGKMIGTDVNPIQIDEARFAGWRKHNRGRMQNGDNAPLSEDGDADKQNNRNDKHSIDGPWVFGLNQGSDCRYFHVQRRDSTTLIPIIERECAPGSVIHSDECSAYANLNAIGYRHLTVNHQENVVDSATGANTQAIERSWLDAKIRSLKKMKGVGSEVFQSHLDHICWKVLRSDAADLFVTFLNDIQSVYCKRM